MKTSGVATVPPRCYLYCLFRNENVFSQHSMSLIQLTFNDGDAEAHRLRLLVEGVTRGRSIPRPAFPASVPDAGLRAIFMVDDSTAAEAGALVSWLETQREIEYAEVAPIRSVTG